MKIDDIIKHKDDVDWVQSHAHHITNLCIKQQDELHQLRKARRPILKQMQEVERSVIWQKSYIQQGMMQLGSIEKIRLKRIAACETFEQVQEVLKEEYML